MVNINDKQFALYLSLFKKRKKFYEKNGFNIAIK